MTIYERLLFPLLKQIDAERAHDLTVQTLAAAQETRAGRQLLRRIAGQVPCRPQTVFGLRFPNELGVAAGYDKNAQVIRGLGLLGFGHVEVGTVTPWVQDGNPRPRVFRLPAERALINRMGFPNQGMTRVVARLRQLRTSSMGQQTPCILGVSIGKQKETDLGAAVQDYLIVMRAVYVHADYLAVNVSSPNTPGLRALQGRDYLEDLLRRLQEENRRLAGREPMRPLLLKIAPDLSWDEIDVVLEAAGRCEVDGLIATNTTVARPGLDARWRAESGGLSGAPLARRSLAIVSFICEKMGDRLPVVAVGGIMSVDDVRARLDAGARLVQVYTGLVYKGPKMAGRILRQLECTHT